jgi:hypothetical protein
MWPGRYAKPPAVLGRTSCWTRWVPPCWKWIWPSPLPGPDRPVRNAGGGEQVPLPPPGRLIGGNLAIGGFSISRLWATAPHRASAGLSRVLDLLAGGRLDIAITEVSSLAQVPAVHQLLAEGRGEGKYVARLVG